MLQEDTSLLNLFKFCFFSSKITMGMQRTLKLIVLSLLLDAARAVVSSSTSPSFSPIVIRAEYEQNYRNTTNATVEYVFLYPASNVSSCETDS